MANYVQNPTWVDGAGGGTPVSAAALNNIEAGITAAHFQPSARAFHSVNQAITTATITALAFDSERFDTDTIHSTSASTSRLTCKTAGKYMIVGNVLWEIVAAGTFREAFIRLNGATYIANQCQPPTSGGIANMVCSTLYDLAVNDYVELLVQHDRGANLNVLAVGNRSPEFMMARLG